MMLLLISLVAAWLQQPVAQPASAPVTANVWQGRLQEFEEYLRTAPVVRLEELKIGVTRPRRAFTEPGGLATAFAWKPIQPGRYSGYFESYKSEIAAYELDKFLQLNMVPVVVERRVKGDTGAAVLWIHGVRSWEAVMPLPKPPGWDRNIVRMKMFDNLIGNSDRNKGNLLVDEAWNLYLIDHSRAFVTDRKLPQQLQNVDRALWDRFLALEEPALKAQLGNWLDGAQIRSMLQRRDLLKKMIDALAAKNGERIFF